MSGDGWAKRRTAPPVLPEDYFRRPPPARMWNYLQGGSDNYAIDKAGGDALASGYPEIFYVAEQTRLFLMRAVRYVASEGGVRQFIDLGCGLPAPNRLLNTHDVAQSVYPEARVVYIDNDKVVSAHARALLTSRTKEGMCVYLDSDVRDTEFILEETRTVLDFDRPIGVLLLGVLGYLVSFDEARSLVRRVMDALAPGSFLLQSDGATTDQARVRAREHQEQTYGHDPYVPRDPEQIAQYFDGLELVEPGVGPSSLWRPEPTDGAAPRPIAEYGGVARKPDAPRR